MELNKIKEELAVEILDELITLQSNYWHSASKLLDKSLDECSQSSDESIRKLPDLLRQYRNLKELESRYRKS